ncbi:hypothetical protein WAK64_16730 [Bacillus spongiae]|uniref:DUF4825 domain-containing protein n=1 Tax=Bacillus spongiae TaxID=2683610 RepID=A0ABU8HH30_9BACI
MKKPLFLLLLSVGLLYGCQPNDTLSFSEKTEDELAKEVQSFFNSVSKENGVHLYNDEQSNSLLVYLNGYNIDQGDSAYSFNNFNVEAYGNNLHLSYETDTTTDYSSEIENQLFYEVSLDKEYDKIKLFNNEDEVAFKTISGNLE